MSSEMTEVTFTCPQGHENTRNMVYAVRTFICSECGDRVTIREDGVQ